jgi:cell division cycle 14
MVESSQAFEIIA